MIKSVYIQLELANFCDEKLLSTKTAMYDNGRCLFMEGAGMLRLHTDRRIQMKFRYLMVSYRKENLRLVNNKDTIKSLYSDS